MFPPEAITATLEPLILDDSCIAAAYAAAMQESSRIKSCKIAVIASGGNIDREVYAAVLNGKTFAA